MPESNKTSASNPMTDVWEWLTENTEWGGHLRQRGSITWPEAESLLGNGESDPLYDAATEFRLINKTFASDRLILEAHYELLWSVGDTRRRTSELALSPSGSTVDVFGLAGSVDDDRRLFDLTHILDQDDGHVISHRMDRLSLTVDRNWGWVRVGRQALTLGNGLIFNPMDLFNPFAPTDIERDYKIGDDMVTVQVTGGEWGSLQALHVARRDPNTGDPDWNSSSTAGKYHTAMGTTEFDLMAACHYEDYVVGVGATGYLLDAAWRADIIWTFLESENRDSYASAVVNLDYSWVWFDKNWYGLIEFFYSGIGETDYADALTDTAIAERLDRGELFTLGRFYLAETVEIELHPLLRFALTNITNLYDPSGLIQPRLLWDVLQNVQVTIGGTIPYGSRDTEFGGFSLSPGQPDIVPPFAGFAWLTYFF